eukprot:1336873-Amphidinium_carterae.2
MLLLMHHHSEDKAAGARSTQLRSYRSRFRISCQRGRRDCQYHSDTKVSIQRRKARGTLGVIHRQEKEKQTRLEQWRAKW